MERQTVARVVRCRGIGLHGGREVGVALHPAPPGSGRVFVCIDPRAPGDPVEIRAGIGAVCSAQRATVLGRPTGAKVATVEHLLASLSLCGIDDVRIEMDGDEVPIFDGSARPLAEWIESAGRRGQGEEVEPLRLDAPLEFRHGTGRMRLEPARRLSVDYTIEFDHPAIGRQRIVLEAVDRDTFLAELAGARTFGFESEGEALRAEGRALGGSLESAVVFGASGIVNPEGLRWPDECVRHKVVDLLGDLALLERPLVARVSVERGGHALHHAGVLGLQARADSGARMERS